MSKLIGHIEYLPFEAKKDAAHIFNNLIRKNLSGFAQYVLENFDIVRRLIEGYSIPDAALNCGSMLRECIRHDELAKAVLESEKLWEFFDSYAHLRNFEVASDSFNTLRDLLTTPKNKLISSSFLDAQYDRVMTHYEVHLVTFCFAIVY